MNHERLTDSERETAALYALGALSEEDASAFEAHLGRGCSACADVLAAFKEVVRGLGYAAPPAAPSPALRQRLLERLTLEPADGLRGQVWKEWSSDPPGPWHLLRANEGEWVGTGFKGVSVRRLFVDRDRQTATMLVRMEAGSAYPAHRHAAPEECYVLEGDLYVGDAVMGKGDYQRVEGDYIHGVQSTRRGCTLLIVSSLGDEILPSGREGI